MDFHFSAEQEEFRKRVRNFAIDKFSPVAMEVDDSYDYQGSVTELLKEQQLFGLFAPKEYGGVDERVSVVKVCIAREELIRVCIQADDLMICQGLGIYPITLFSTEEQKRKYLPSVSKGEKLISFCLTEPGAGSDIAGIQMTATLKGDHYLLNGTKSFVSRPEEVDIIVVFAKTDPAQGGKGISAFIAEKGGTGFEAHNMKLMFPYCDGAITLTDYMVPKTNMLGQPGKGMRIALTTLTNLFRITVGAAAVGLAQRALEEAIAYAKRRHAFGQPLFEFQATQFKLAEMVTMLDAGRLLVYRAASLSDEGASSVAKEASMAKLFATEAAHRIVDQALQIFGGIGLAKGQRIEQLYRAARASRIYEGTSEIQHLVIARDVLKET